MKLTIHTATYNREHILHKAYESLKSQTVKNFIWLITDDGSTDNTKEIVEKWQKENNEFQIIYNKIPHGGIPRAFNSGVEHTETEWFMMLDSDDYFKPNAVELVLKWVEEVEHENKICGIGFARCYPDGKYMKNQIPKINIEQGYVDATNLERTKYNLDMDMSEVYRTQLLKRYPFKVWKSEMFAPEQISFNEMAFDGWKIRWRAERLRICEYLPDGMTKDNSIVKNNPMGFAMMYNQNLLIHEKIHEKFKDVIQMIALIFYAKEYKYLRKSNCKWLTILGMPLGVALSVRRRIQFSRLK